MLGLLAGCDQVKDDGDDGEQPIVLEAADKGSAGDTAETGEEQAGDEKSAPAEGTYYGWISNRGPHQTGVSDEKNLPDDWTPGGPNERWTLNLQGRGTPVVLGNRVYIWGYRGAKADLVEVLACVDAATGKVHWEHEYSDFLSDNIYNRYAIGSPAVDAETGRVYLLTTPGEFICLDAQGKELWRHSMMEAFGRLTFPNGRTGGPVIDGDLVIVRGITTFWGNQGPPRDRFYAFDKKTGEHVWASTPGTAPKDSSSSTPVFGNWDGRRVMYCGTGCGNIVAVDAGTGDPLWRYHFSYGGVNSAVVPYGEDKLIVIHAKENIDSSETGRMAALKLPAKMEGKEQMVLTKASEIWRNEIKAFSSDPVVAGNRAYVTTMTGELACVDCDNGKILWRHKLSNEQLHAGPVYGDGKLYIPMLSGECFIVRPNDAGPRIVSEAHFPGNCLGAPAIHNGRVYVHTTEKFFCFGAKKGGRPVAYPTRAASPAADKAPKPVLHALPNELLLRPGEKQALRFRWSNGQPYDPAGGTWAGFIPPTAKVQAKLNGAFATPTEFTADAKSVPSAGMFKFTGADKSVAMVRGRILPQLPLKEDFEGFKLAAKDAEGKAFAFPPLPWIGARFKWEVRELDGNKVLAKTLDRVILMRAVSFIGHPDMSNYTLRADVMTDGNRRVMSSVGLVNQRYIVALIGNWQILEISSNHDRVKVSVPFKWEAKKWYTLKTRVDRKADGSGTVRAKAWPKGEAEPEKWTIEAPLNRVHANGSPGIFGFSPQSLKSVFVDHISVTPNE